MAIEDGKEVILFQFQYGAIGRYGLLVRKAEIAGAEGDYLEFENLTWAPLEPALIDAAMLSPTDIAWVNDYHAQVLDIVGSLLDGDDKAWLKTVCQPIG